jgi:hypothetical protein
MPAVEFTQYLRPSGNTRPIYIDVDEPLHAMAQAVIAAGQRFEAELLSDGLVSLTVADPDLRADVAIRVCSNDEAVPRSVDELIIEAHERLGRKGWFFNRDKD